MGLFIDKDRAALLIVDVQERLAAAMPTSDREECERNVVLLIEMARRLGLPVVVSEQYPRGLGATTPAVASALDQAGGSVHRFEKMDFSCSTAEGFEPIWDKLHKEQWIVTGMESHVCVYQSARGLLQRGANVHVVRDAVCSRTQQNREVGLSLAERAGAVITCAETVVFDALRKAGGDDFKALSKLIK